MTASLTIEGQIERFQENLEALVQCVTSLDQRLFLEKLGGWAPRDIVAHLVGWNRYVIEGSEQLKNKELPFYDVDAGENYSSVNAVLVRRHSSRDREVLLEELRASARELKEYLRSLDPGEWDRDYGVRNEGSVITIRDTVDELIADYAHHRSQIEDWTGA